MNKTVETKSVVKVRRTTDYLGRTYIWELYRMLPIFALISIEIRKPDGDEYEVVDTLTFQRTKEDEDKCKEALYELLGKYSEDYSKVTAEFEYGFGFACKIRVYVH